MTKRNEVQMKSRMMKMNRLTTLRTTKGYIVEFKANVPTAVPSLVIEQAIEIGAAFCSEDKDFVPQNNVNTAEQPLYGFERKQALYDACIRILGRNSPDDFTSTGLPKMKLVEDEVGFNVDRNEVNKSWVEAQKAHNNSE